MIRNNAFTLIELLIVIAIIGILAGIIISSLNSAREKGRIASIKSTLKNLQNQAQIHHLENGTFAGLCTYNASGITPHTSIQSFIDSLVSVVGENHIRCVVRTSNVPSTASADFVPGDMLEETNFGVALWFNGKHYAVDAKSIMVLDDDYSGSTTNWTTANNRC